MIGLLLKTMPERCGDCPLVNISEGINQGVPCVRAQFAECYPVVKSTGGKQGRIGTYPITPDSPPIPQIERPDWCPLIDMDPTAQKIRMMDRYCADHPDYSGAGVWNAMTAEEKLAFVKGSKDVNIVTDHIAKVLEGGAEHEKMYKG